LDKPKRRFRNAYEFVSPFPLNVCLQRLRARGLSTVDGRTQVNAVAGGADIHHFNIRKLWFGVTAKAYGMLESAEDGSALVHIHGINASPVMLSLMLLFFATGIHACILLEMMVRIVFMGNPTVRTLFMGGDPAEPLPLPIDYGPRNLFWVVVIITVWLVVFGVIWWARRSAIGRMRQLVNNLLGDPIPDLPDLGQDSDINTNEGEISAKAASDILTQKNL
jgi:uncharacterized protein YggT (Ycf19 family)